jgi:hypothetical protein
MGWRSFYSLGTELFFRQALQAYQVLVAAVTWSWVLCVQLVFLCVIKIAFNDCHSNVGLWAYIAAMCLSLIMIIVDKYMLVSVSKEHTRRFIWSAFVGFVLVTLIVIDAAPTDRQTGQSPSNPPSNSPFNSPFDLCSMHLLIHPSNAC